jgi:hypothetical protein
VDLLITVNPSNFESKIIDESTVGEVINDITPDNVVEENI